MNPYRILITSLLFLGAASQMTSHAADLRMNDRIVFLGDSITQAGVGPKGYVTLVGKGIKEKFPVLPVEIIGAGISGHKVPDLQKRLERDVLSKKPTKVIIYIGINDVWHSQMGRGTPKDRFRSGLLDIIRRIHDVDAQVILCTPSVIGEKPDGSNELDGMLEEYAAISREVAAEKKVQLLDLNKAFIAWEKAYNSGNVEQGLLTTDGVHLNAAGNRFVAGLMLQALGVNDVPRRVLRHIVLFKFKDGTPQAQVDEIARAFAGLKDRIDSIEDFEWGLNNSPEGLADGFTHGFQVTFRDEAGREKYLPHAAHQEFVSLLKPKLDKVLVLDYWSTE